MPFKITPDTIIIEDEIFPMFLVKSFLRSIEIDLQEFLIGGWGNGYVGLPKWHPYFELNYEEIPIRIHGGLTYSDYNENKKLWVIGFDTNHFGDSIENCSMDYVKKETYHLLIKCCELTQVQRILKLNQLKYLKTN